MPQSGLSSGWPTAAQGAVRDTRMLISLIKRQPSPCQMIKSVCVGVSAYIYIYIYPLRKLCLDGETEWYPPQFWLCAQSRITNLPMKLLRNRKATQQNEGIHGYTMSVAHGSNVLYLTRRFELLYIYCRLYNAMNLLYFTVQLDQLNVSGQQAHIRPNTNRWVHST